MFGLQKIKKSITIRKATTTLVIVLIILILIIALNYNEALSWEKIFTDTQALENINYLFQIVVSIAVVLGGVLALWQYILTARCEIAKNRNDRIQKAIDLSGYYKDKVLCCMKPIYDVYDEVGILDIVNSVDVNSMKSFTTNELYKIYGSKKIDRIKEIMQSHKLIEALIKVGEVYNFYDASKCSIKINEDGKRERVLEINPSQLFEKFINGVLSEALNNMEYFSMHFTHHTADESVVYQSLHITYIELVQMLYYNIAKNNEDAENKLYTNTIELFNIWIDRANEQKQREYASTCEVVHKGNVAMQIK